ncbi:hypothetical protein WJX82_004976 [Trebouxia sp. C0006]
MNAEEASLLWNRKDDVEQAGGHAAHRQLALKHLKLKTVIKESHCSPVHHLVFNYTDEGMQNLFATVGKEQATIYDDLHMGDFIAVVVNFTNQKTEYADGGELHTCTWLSGQHSTPHPHGDALLAVAGADHNISLISCVEARVIALLQGHIKDVVDLSACSSKPGLLVSLSKDGNARVWDVTQELCISSYNTDASCLAVSPDGAFFVTGSKKGALHSYQIAAPQQQQQQLVPSSRDTNLQTTLGSVERKQLSMECSSSGRHTETIDCMQFLSQNRLATKSVDGRMCVWDLAARKQLSSWKVPSCNVGGGWASRCRFGCTPDGAYICVGNTTGDVYVYDTSDGKRMTHVAPIKVSAPVRACGLSPDCRHLLAVIGNGFIFRFEYRKPDAEVSNKENSDTNMIESDNE